VALVQFNWVAVVIETPYDTEYHLFPLEDLQEHTPFVDCWCIPAADDDDPDIWVHNALDRREEYERGRPRH
jgi:hypothetical protein